MDDLVQENSEKVIVGIEVGRQLVRAVVFDEKSRTITAYADSANISLADSNAANPSHALVSVWRKLQIGFSANARVAVAVGAKNSGIGSGPAIVDWIASLESQLGRPVVRAGEPDKGVSYFPESNLEAVLTSFDAIGVSPERVELAPISVARVLPKGVTCAVSVDSSIGWRARLHTGHVLEALAYPDGFNDQGVMVELPGAEATKLTKLTNISVASHIFKENNVDISSIACVAGAALGLLETKAIGNLKASDSDVAEDEATTQKLKAVQGIPVSTDVSWPGPEGSSGSLAVKPSTRPTRAPTHRVKKVTVPKRKVRVASKARMVKQKESQRVKKLQLVVGFLFILAISMGLFLLVRALA